MAEQYFAEQDYTFFAAVSNSKNDDHKKRRDTKFGYTVDGGEMQELTNAKGRRARAEIVDGQLEITAQFPKELIGKKVKLFAYTKTPGDGKSFEAEVVEQTASQDWYLDSINGKVLGKGASLNSPIRLIYYSTFEDIKNKYGGDITTSEAIDELQNGEEFGDGEKNSILVTIDDAQIQNELQAVNDLSRKVEHQTYIVLDKVNAKVFAKRGTPGTVDKTPVNLEERKSHADKYVVLLSQEDYLVLAQAHGHPKTTKKGHKSGSGVSKKDIGVAKRNGIVIYAVEAYHAPVGGKGIINRVLPNGDEDPKIGTTRGNGADRSGTVNIGLEALQYWSGIKN